MQFLNMQSMDVIDDIVLFPKVTFSKFIQSQNIKVISVTKEVSNFDRSISLILVSPLNIFEQELISPPNFKVILFKSPSRSDFFTFSSVFMELIIT